MLDALLESHKKKEGSKEEPKEDDADSSKRLITFTKLSESGEAIDEISTMVSLEMPSSQVLMKVAPLLKIEEIKEYIFVCETKQIDLEASLLCHDIEKNIEAQSQTKPVLWS